MLEDLVSQYVAVSHFPERHRCDDSVFLIREDYVSFTEKLRDELHTFLSHAYRESDDSFKLMLLDVFEHAAVEILSQNCAEN